MVKPKVLENPMYSNLLFDIILGETKPKTKHTEFLTRDRRIEAQLERNRESKRMSKRRKQLLKTPEGYSFIKKINGDYYANYEGIMNYIHKRFVVFSEVKSNPEHLGLLKNYLIELSTIPEIKGKHDKGLRYILEKFVIGMGKEFSKNLSKELMKDDFLAWCWSYSLAKGGEDYDVFASDILRKKLKERGCLIVKTHFYPLKMPKEIGKNNLEIISG